MIYHAILQIGLGYPITHAAITYKKIQLIMLLFRVDVIDFSLTNNYESFTYRRESREHKGGY